MPSRCPHYSSPNHVNHRRRRSKSERLTRLPKPPKFFGRQSPPIFRIVRAQPKRTGPEMITWPATLPPLRIKTTVHITITVRVVSRDSPVIIPTNPVSLDADVPQALLGLGASPIWPTSVAIGVVVLCDVAGRWSPAELADRCFGQGKSWHARWKEPGWVLINRYSVRLCSNQRISPCQWLAFRLLTDPGYGTAVRGCKFCELHVEHVIIGIGRGRRCSAVRSDSTHAWGLYM